MKPFQQGQSGKRQHEEESRRRRRKQRRAARRPPRRAIHLSLRPRPCPQTSSPCPALCCPGLLLLRRPALPCAALSSRPRPGPAPGRPSAWVGRKPQPPRAPPPCPCWSWLPGQAAETAVEAWPPPRRGAPPAAAAPRATPRRRHASARRAALLAGGTWSAGSPLAQQGRGTKSWASRLAEERCSSV